jgi:hypothetical protein
MSTGTLATEIEIDRACREFYKPSSPQIRQRLKLPSITTQADVSTAGGKIGTKLLRVFTGDWVILYIPIQVHIPAPKADGVFGEKPSALGAENLREDLKPTQATTGKNCRVRLRLYQPIQAEPSPLNAQLR